MQFFTSIVQSHYNMKITVKEVEWYHVLFTFLSVHKVEKLKKGIQKRRQSPIFIYFFFIFSVVAKDLQ